MAAASTASQIFSVEGIVAVVTGGATGIGLTMTHAFATNGARKVYILGRRRDALEAVAQKYPNVIPVECDVSSKPSLQTAAARIEKEVGYINFLAANSGIVGTSAAWDPSATLEQNYETLFTNTSMEEFTNTFHVNTTGAFYTMLAFLKLLDAGNKSAVEKGTFGTPATPGGKVPAIQSQVLVTSSVGAFMRAQFTWPAYGGSKAAIWHMMKQASTMLASYGIRTNAIAPGWFPSEMSAGVLASRLPEEELPEDPQFIPARRFGGYEEMAGTVLYLASQAGSYNNGMIILNDGGRTSVIPATY